MRNTGSLRFSRGFTLIELSMALVIIALIAGGIVAGQSLVRSAQLQSIAKDEDQYVKAIQTFKEKYHELPGDMENATDFWGVDTGCTTSPLSDATAANVTPKTATCNGNGDGFIGDAAGTPLTTTTNWHESYRIWQHLVDAGVIKGSYTGALSSRTSGNKPDPGMNIPASKISGAGLSILYAAPTTAGATGYFPGNYHHVIVFGAPVSAHASTYGAAISPADAESIDQKLDDGKPGTGNIMSFPTGTLASCTTGDYTASATATYKISDTNLDCSLIFITGF